VTTMIVSYGALLASGRETAGVVALAVTCISLMVVMLLLRSLQSEWGVKPVPTGSPEQHVPCGCVALLVMAVVVAIAYVSKGG